MAIADDQERVKRQRKFLSAGNPLVYSPPPHLEIADDGSLTIYMQHGSPGPDKEPNWPPTPAGDFRPVMRDVPAEGEILCGDYRLPVIRKVAKARERA
jgi:hypothetical protein